MRSRTTDIIGLLLKAPMTAAMILRASVSFEKPYRSLSSVQADLLYLMRDRGWLARQELPSFGPGQNEMLYFLTPRAGQVSPEVAELGTKSSAFRGCAASLLNQKHTLGISSFVVEALHSATRSRGRVEFLEVVRENQFVIATPNSKNYTALKPDFTLLASLDGVPNLFFLELHNRQVINPADPGRRSFQGKLALYKEFLGAMHAHPVIQAMQAAHCRQSLPGFRVLVVSARDERNLKSLIASASDYHSLFYFSTLRDLTAGNVFVDRGWRLPSGQTRALIN